MYHKPSFYVKGICVLAITSVIAGCGQVAKETGVSDEKDAPVSIESQANKESVKPAPFKVKDLVDVEEGTLPVILSAPHGGKKVAKSVNIRTNDITYLDYNTSELTDAIQKSLLKKTGKKAFVVKAIVSRKYIDFNREKGSGSFENPSMAPVYDYYYQSLSEAADSIKKINKKAAILIDIHCQSEDRNQIFRGTYNGKTADLNSLNAPNGLIGTMIENKLSVVMNVNGSAREQLRGDEIINSEMITKKNIDRIQLEFGGKYIDDKKVNATADKMADAIISHLRSQGYKI